MTSELPRGTLVITKTVDADEIKIGDNITFFKSQNQTCTHKVVSVIENYNGSGELGFQTKGTENPLPDSDIVLAKNVIGKVVFHAKGVGDTLSYIKAHWLVAVGMVAGVAVVIISLKIVITPQEGSAEQEKRVKIRRKFIPDSERRCRV